MSSRWCSADFRALYFPEIEFVDQECWRCGLVGEMNQFSFNIIETLCHSPICCVFLDLQLLGKEKSESFG